MQSGWSGRERTKESMKTDRCCDKVKGQINQSTDVRGEVMKMIEKLNSGDYITIDLFGQKREVMVFSTGDNQFDENGSYKEDGFALSDEEIHCLNWFLQTIKIEDYKQAIVEYCNELYEMVGEKQIEEAEVEKEIDICAIAINVTELIGDKDFVYPEISFYGTCECDPEHGICIGFRDQKFLGIGSQDWTL